MRKIFIAVLAVAAMAMAESHTHDGFFLNLALGFGYQGFTYDANKAIFDMEANGMSSEFDIKLGGCIAPNTLLHATILGVANVGIGVTYYLPQNVFFSGSIGLAAFNLQDNTDSDNEITGQTDSGLGVQLAVGKEWWVSDNWGLGVSAAFTYGAAEDKDDMGDANAFGVNVMFSATFN